MFGSLNIKTRRAVLSLCSGETITLGGQTVGPLSEESRKLLALLAVNLNTLQKLRAADLIVAVLRLYKDFKFEEFTEGAESDGIEEVGTKRTRFMIGKIRAYSFRGLAPAGRVWEHDFQGESHLLYGPNGCGKSSVLGAICWCLTGRVFRDDCEPRATEKIRAYPAEGTGAGRVDRDDAQALIDADGNSSRAEEPYWVKVQLLGEYGNGNTEEVWLKRHSDEGLSRSDDGNEWSEISSIEEIGIEEVDAELHLLMPAKVSYLEFGKNSDLVHLLAEIVGYGNLETIAEVAKNLGSYACTVATNTENRELQPEETRIEEFVEDIKNLANDAIKLFPTYQKICKETRTKNDIEEFGKAIAKGIEAGKKQLAADLGIDVPEEETEEYKNWQKKSNNLPGQVSNLLAELEKPLREIFPSSIGLETPSIERIRELEKQLKAFEERAENEIEERLAWAIKEQSEEKVGLMLKASCYFPEGSNNCPVCTQVLDPVPEIKIELEKMRDSSSKEYLQKTIEDHDRSLVADLDKIVTPENRIEGQKSFGERLEEDWVKLKEDQCKDLLLAIAERFDEGLGKVSGEIQFVEVEEINIPSEYVENFGGAFSNFREALRRAKKYLELCKSISENRDTASEKIELFVERVE